MSQYDEKIELTHALLGLNKDTAAQTLAFLENITIRKALVSKANDWWGWVSGGSRDNLKEVTEKSVQAYQSVPSDELRVRVIFTLIDALEIEVKDINVFKNAESISDIMAHAIDRTIKNQKELNPDFDGTSLEDVCRINVEKLIKESLDPDKFEKASGVDQENLVKEITGFLLKCPENKQKEIRDALNVDKISEKSIREALVSGALAGAFLLTLEVSGFAFYMAASKLLSITFGWLFSGLGLGLAPYIFASSLISILSVALIPILFTWGALKFRKRGSEMRKSIINILISIIMISYNSHDLNAQESKKIGDNISSTLFKLESIINTVQANIVYVEGANKALQSQKEEYKIASEYLANIKKEKNKAEIERVTLISELQNKITLLESDEQLMKTIPENLIKSLKACRNSLAAFDNESNKEREGRGWLSKVFHDLKTTWNRADYENEISIVVKQIVSYIIENQCSVSPELDEITKRFNGLYIKISGLISDIDKSEINKIEKRDQMNDAKEHLKRCQKKLDKSAENYTGILKLVKS